MVCASETPGFGGGRQLVMKLGLEICAEAHVQHGAALGAHQMVMVTARDVFGQFEMGMVLARDDSMDHVGRFENGEVAVRRALGQARSVAQELHDGLWVCFAVQRLDDLSSAAGVPLAARSQSLQGGIVDGCDAESLTCVPVVRVALANLIVPADLLHDPGRV